MRDMGQKGRGRGDPHKGERNGMSKLNAQQVTMIRQRVQAGEPQKPLAAEFGVSTSTISNVVKGRCY
jgi:hypothetical protein